MRQLICICVVTLALGCAAESAQSAEPVQPAQAADEPGEDNPEFQRVAKQYRQVEKDGRRLYCRTEKRLGTRLGSPVCLTEAQLWERIRKAESVRDQMRNKPAPCPPDRNCN